MISVRNMLFKTFNNIYFNSSIKSSFNQLINNMEGAKKWSDQITVGDLKVKNRIMLAALTRCRCDPNLNIPNDLNLKYYSQRTGAGIMLTEAAAVSQRGQGFYGAAALYNNEHAEGWKKIVDSVHQKNTYIFAQLVHCGRATLPAINKGLQPHAPSALRRRQVARGFGDYPIPKQMTLQQIEEAKNEFRNSFKLAKQVGFDGIQVHGAHGYLIDNFIKSEVNIRKDKYGGSAENRSRFCLQIVDIAIEIFGANRVGIKLSPAARTGDVMDLNPIETYSYLMTELDKRGIAFVQLRESNEPFIPTNLYGVLPIEQIPNVCKALRPYFKGVIVGNNNLTLEQGLKKINEGEADMISFGRLYISNPDLAQRILNNQPLNYKWDMSTFYSPGPKGYIDYKTYEEQQNEINQKST